MATRKMDKYADYHYVFPYETGLEEAKWFISLGDFKDLDDYINYITRAEIKWMKQQDSEREKRAIIRKQRRIETVKKNKAA